MSMGGGSDSSGQAYSTKDTNQNIAWQPGTQAASNVLGDANYMLADGTLLNPNSYQLSADANSVAENPSNVTQSSNIYSSLADPNSAINANLSQMASGSNTNPQLNAMYNQAAGSVQNSLAGEFNSAGRLGSGAQEFNTSQGLNNLATDIYGGAYAQNQSNALAADQSLQSGEQSGAQGLTGNYTSLLTGDNLANSLDQSTSNAAALGAYSSLVDPYVNLNSTDQNNNYYDPDNDGSFSKDLGYVSSIASLVGAFA